MPKNSEKNVPETEAALTTETETTEVREVDGSEIKGGPTTSDRTEGQTTETIATDVQTDKSSTMIGIAPNATTPTLLDERSATAVKRLALKAAAVAVKDSSAGTTGEADSNAVTTGETVGLKAETTTQTTGHALHATTQISRSETPAIGATHLAQRAVEAVVVATTVAVTNAAMTVETAGIEATNETTAPEAGVSRTEISTRTIGPVLRATTQISRSEPPATDARHPAPAVVAVMAVAAEAVVAATTEATVVATAVPSNETTASTAVTVGLSEETTVASNETTAPTAVTVGHSDETTVAVAAAAGASSPETTGARLRTGRTDAHEENAQGTPTTNRPVTSGTTRRGNLTENETNEAVPWLRSRITSTLSRLLKTATVS
ncbi:MAG: hypothetical protein ACO20Y_05815 [Poseidonia sp.]